MGSFGEILKDPERMKSLEGLYKWCDSEDAITQGSAH